MALILFINSYTIFENKMLIILKPEINIWIIFLDTYILRWITIKNQLSIINIQP